MYHNPTFLNLVHWLASLCLRKYTEKPLQQIVRKGMVNISQQIVPHYFQPFMHLEHVKVAFHIRPICVSLWYFLLGMK